MTEQMPDQRFPLILMSAILILGLTLGIQVHALNAESSQDSQEFGMEDVDVSVDVGDGYFQQEGLPEDEIEAEVGDVIYFENVGNIPHTATVQELGFDEHLDPGEGAFLQVEESVEEAVMDCTLHAHHEGTLTVNE